MTTKSGVRAAFLPEIHHTIEALWHPACQDAQNSEVHRIRRATRLPFIWFWENLTAV